MDRRNFLKGSAQFGAGLMLTDVMKLYQGIEATMIKQAYAADTYRNYVNLHISGGPARWTFDQWLTPNPSDLTLSSATASTWNPGIATAYNANNPEYRLWTYKGLRVPHLFQTMVSTPTGQRPMSDLLDNMAVIRGYDSLTDGHETNAPLQTFPDPSVQSLTGLAADYSSSSIAAVGTNFGSHPFKSKRGKGMTPVTSHSGVGGSIGTLMKSFKKAGISKTGLLKIDQIRTVIDTMYAASKNAAAQSNSRAGAIADQLKSARDLAVLAAEDLNAIWTPLYNKYRNLMNPTLLATMSQAGFSESPILFAANEGRTAEVLVSSTFDLRQAVATAGMSRDIAISFALAEYCLTRGITSSLGIGGNEHIYNLSLLKEGDATVTTGLGHSADQHFTPARLNVIYNSCYFRALSAGLLEFIRVLKSVPVIGKGNLFDNTVIHVTGDFARNPRTDKYGATKNTGSDHAFMGQVTSVFSGVIDGPVVVGNISSQGITNYEGIWGSGAPVDFNGSSETLSPRHAAAAVANLIGVPNPWPFTHLVWSLNSAGRMEPKVGAKII